MVPAHHQEEPDLVYDDRQLGVIVGDAHGFSWTVVQSPGDLAILEHGVGDGVFSVGDTDNDTLGARHRVRAALLVLCYNLV